MPRSGYITVTLRFYEEEDQWVGRCLELGTMACGDTREIAEEALQEAMEMKIEGLAELGELDSFLAKHGIPFYARKPRRLTSFAEVPVDPSVYTQRQLIAVN